jgi:hypothetical protein
MLSENYRNRESCWLPMTTLIKGYFKLDSFKPLIEIKWGMRFIPSFKTVELPREDEVL